jgi:hypothetical protein
MGGYKISVVLAYSNQKLCQGLLEGLSVIKVGI